MKISITVLLLGVFLLLLSSPGLNGLTIGDWQCDDYLEVPGWEGPCQDESWCNISCLVAYPGNVITTTACTQTNEGSVCGCYYCPPPIHWK